MDQQMKILLSSAVMMMVTLVVNAAQNGSISVSSSANIYGASSTNIYEAGHTPPAPGGGGGGVWPSSITSSAPLGYVVLFTNVTGSISMSSSLGVLNNPDGNSSFSTDISPFGGISGIRSDASGFLAGVFLGPAEPMDPALATLDFRASGLGTSFLTLSPQIGQLFFIGDGRTGTGSGVIQQFFVPATATRLYLGFADAPGYMGPPGQYQDNVGLLNVSFRILNAPCALTCSTNITVCNDPGQCGAVVRFAPPVAASCNGLIIGCVPPSGSFFPVGTNTVLCTAMNAAGQVSNSCTFEVAVQDCQPPVIDNITATPQVLWPPNHRMEQVTVRVSATDNCHLARCRIISVTSNESSLDPGSGHTAPDWQITGDLTVNLRAEHSGTGTGRVYGITVECTDDAGNAVTAVTNVALAHQ